MSWQARALNHWLRWTERPVLARTQAPETLRRNFETKARLFFHGPRGLGITPTHLGTQAALQLDGPWVEDSGVILYFHGGGYVFGSPKAYQSLVGQLSRRSRCAAFVPSYPLAPENAFPAALQAARAAYDGLIALGFAPSQIVMGGDSAGGNLVLALLAQLVQDRAERPAAVFAFSPLTDLTFSGASFRTNAARDVVLPAHRAKDMAEMFLAGHAPDDPLVSPVFADFTGASPVWLSVGDTEILLDDTRRVAQAMRRQGVEVEMHVARDLPHVWPLFHNTLPEARATLDQLSGWIRRQLAR